MKQCGCGNDIEPSRRNQAKCKACHVAYMRKWRKQKPKLPPLPEQAHRQKKPRLTTLLSLGDDFDYHGKIFHIAVCSCGWKSHPVVGEDVKPVWQEHFMRQVHGAALKVMVANGSDGGEPDDPR